MPADSGRMAVRCAPQVATSTVRRCVAQVQNAVACRPRRVIALPGSATILIGLLGQEEGTGSVAMRHSPQAPEHQNTLSTLSQLT